MVSSKKRMDHLRVYGRAQTFARFPVMGDNILWAVGTQHQYSRFRASDTEQLSKDNRKYSVPGYRHLVSFEEHCVKGTVQKNNPWATTAEHLLLAHQYSLQQLRMAFER